MKNVCFTGHRTINETEELRERLYALLEELISDGAENFYAGGCFGWDNFCADTVIRLREKYPQIKLHIIMPCPENEQTVGWTERDREQYRNILRHADSIEICSEHASRTSNRKRNARLVKLSECCICYYNEQNPRSGTGQTVRMAGEKGIKILNLCWSV